MEVALRKLILETLPDYKVTPDILPTGTKEGIVYQVLRGPMPPPVHRGAANFSLSEVQISFYNPSRATVAQVQKTLIDRLQGFCGTVSDVPLSITVANTFTTHDTLRETFVAHVDLKIQS